MVLRVGEAGALKGQAKLDRVKGLLAQVEFVSAQAAKGVYPDLATLSTTPAACVSVLAKSSCSSRGG